MSSWIMFVFTFGLSLAAVLGGDDHEDLAWAGSLGVLIGLGLGIYLRWTQT